MATRSVGRGSGAITHELSEKRQGKYHYTMGPYSDPVLHIRPGDRVVIETRDAFEGVIRNETDKPSDLLRMPFLNPQNGPIMVEGAEKGDALAVYIEFDGAARRKPPRYLLPNRGIRRADRHGLYGDAQYASS